MNKKNKRILSPYEKNQLAKYGIDQSDLLKTESPVEYLTGHVDFCDLDFLVDENVLIPRVETEELVQLAIEKAEEIHQNQPKKAINLIDVGTGSGAIAISVAKKLEIKNIPYEFFALDISKKALAVAAKNHHKIGAELKIKFFQSDLLESFLQKADIIIANLPYVPSERIPTLDESVKNFEPHLALDGGKDGLDLVRKLLNQAKNILSKSGMILLEIDITHDLEKMSEFENEWNVDLVKSVNGGVYFALITQK